MTKRNKTKRTQIELVELQTSTGALPNGDITVCYADLNSKGFIGNILKEKLSNIYNKPEYVKMLKIFMNGKKENIKLRKDYEMF